MITSTAFLPGARREGGGWGGVLMNLHKGFASNRPTMIYHFEGCRFAVRGRGAGGRSRSPLPACTACSMQQALLLVLGLF